MARPSGFRPVAGRRGRIWMRWRAHVRKVEMIEAAAIGEIESGENDETEQDVDVAEDHDGHHDECENSKDAKEVVRIAVPAPGFVVVEIAAVTLAHLLSEFAALPMPLVAPLPALLAPFVALLSPLLAALAPLFALFFVVGTRSRRSRVARLS